MKQYNFKKIDNFSNRNISNSIIKLKIENINKFSFLNKYYLNELPKITSKKNIHQKDSSFNKEISNKLKNNEDVIFKRIYNRHLNKEHQIKDLTIKSKSIQTKEEIKNNMIKFFNCNDTNKKIMNIKNKLYYMKGIFDYSHPLIVQNKSIRQVLN